MRNLKPFLLSLMILCCSTALAQEYVPTKENLQAREAFQDRKFGIFLHWGIYSMMGDGEWVMNNKNINYKEYEKLATGFYPSEFDAEEWVKSFRDAGVKYITITSRHHDGFSMFKTATSDYNIVDGTPFKRDVLKELAQACQKYGLVLSFYYSHLDWHRLDYPLGTSGLGVGRPTDQQDWNSYFKFMNTQLTELLTNYGPIGAIWFDGLWDKKGFDWQLNEQYDLIHKLQPACMVGNNHHIAVKYGEDMQIFERDLPGEDVVGYSKGVTVSTTIPLESCQTINDTWGYSATDNNYKSTKELIQRLVRAAGMNANFLLNLGPQPNGKLPQKALDRLKEIGEWTSKYGETIYGTRGGIVKPHEWGVTTQKGQKLYVHIMSLQDQALFLPIDAKTVKKAAFFDGGEPVKMVKGKEGVTLELGRVPKETDCIVELTLN